VFNFIDIYIYLNSSERIYQDYLIMRSVNQGAIQQKHEVSIAKYKIRSVAIIAIKLSYMKKS
jgi:hypothetical protein